MKSAILCKGDHFTYMRSVFNAINNQQTDYNWLLSDYECYSDNNEVQLLFPGRYEKISNTTYRWIESKVWISGVELTKTIEKDNPQFTWGVFSGFNKNVLLEDILKHPLPIADGNRGFWEDNVKIQHPLADVEIVAWDGSLTLFISRQDILVDMFMERFPLAENLEQKNRRENAQISHIESLLINALKLKQKDINEKSLHLKYNIWRELYEFYIDKGDTVSDDCINMCISRFV